MAHPEDPRKVIGFLSLEGRYYKYILLVGLRQRSTPLRTWSKRRSEVHGPEALICICLLLADALM